MEIRTKIIKDKFLLVLVGYTKFRVLLTLKMGRCRFIVIELLF
jgi:hypothetical protein